ncbi:hypothetical protein [Paenibacillus polymyxa]|uniref:Uncharacterized protein n=1 Tax=Paenibacillus polymyxa (strain SC2) TaxID=886882 RepID=A0A0D5ZCL0_PAEPS|nr:hypothetical protein [Paenibacillus polymyxa]AKA44282.1 hypothetical protein PPSC2_16365 [Paenibacillus polymyxa SC2]WPQ55224.1 hypothetical protein SKN87_16680 [Paenibacillus polymyxa]CCI70117.1 hypothetical protein PPM_3308 [Paenibacillus polymyxa M1]
MRGQIKDPLYQTRIKQTVRDRDGRVLGEVFVLDSTMLPVKMSRKHKKRGRKHRMKTVCTDEIYRVIDDLETKAETSESGAAEALQYAASELRKVLK